MIHRIKQLFIKKSSKSYIKYLRKKGILIGNNTTILSPNHCHMDENRASWISIGSDVVICYGVSIIAHDYSWYVFKNRYDDYVPSGGDMVVIGNNVFIGENSTLLKGSKIGNNCIVAAGSVVTKKFPDDVVIGGVPAKVIMSLDQFYNKKKENLLDEIKREVRDFIVIHGRLPNESEMKNYEILFKVNRSENGEKRLGCLKEENYYFKKIKPMFDGYNDFIKRISEDL